MFNITAQSLNITMKDILLSEKVQNKKIEWKQSYKDKHS